jgi:F-type H+-transporting ATPase subunit b
MPGSQYLRALKVREEYIEFSLKDAAHAKEELQQLSETRVKMMESARLERENLIREARDIKNDIIREAREAAEIEADKMIHQAREKLERERKMALADIRQQIGLMSLEIAGKIMKEELVTDEKQKAVISQYLENVQFN